MYPLEALRELIANALIHQDLSVTGAGPMIEVFASRLEVSNPGVPLIDIDRLLDEPPRTRNERVARLMRQMRFCEERGSGIDRVVGLAEIFQLPAPDFAIRGQSFVATLLTPRSFAEMSLDERARACYQHACLRWVAGRNTTTNATLRERFGLPASRAAQITKVLKEAVERRALRDADPKNRSRAQSAYLPYWA